MNNSALLSVLCFIVIPLLIVTVAEFFENYRTNKYIKNKEAINIFKKENDFLRNDNLEKAKKISKLEEELKWYKSKQKIELINLESQKLNLEEVYDFDKRYSKGE